MKLYSGPLSLFTAKVRCLIDAGFYPTRAGDGGSERKQLARGELARLHLELDKQLAGREYFCDRFSVGDIGNFIMLSTAASLGAPPAAAHTNLQGWLARVGGRPALKREIDGMSAFVRGLLPTRTVA